ncbi:aldo/keto reductase [Grimontia sp. SpTr1]|uniref:aldo/keto reductase n=1 Tax=Grimontia sp. SpTr1 TaxID=2995319 RepID=UPI00248C2248|nr:aldo/keto reductase [Grimontia sp. SpTr1]
MADEHTLSTGMGKVRLGHAGPMVSKLALGAMTFGAETSEQEAFNQLDLFVESGGNFIDTADNYSAGLSEAIIGKWGKSRGGLDNVLVATKGRFSPPPGSYGASRRSLIRSVDASLRRLQLDAIDVYYIHGWDKDTDVMETLVALGDLVTAGKIHYTAWSNLTGWQLQRVITTAKENGLPVPVAMQSQYSLLERDIELELLPCCLEEGIGMTPWSPLGGGWLTGKYQKDLLPIGETRLGENPNRGVEAYHLRNRERTYRVLEALNEIATQHQRSVADIALAWLAQRPGVCSILLGARTAEQLKANLAAAQIHLPDKHIQALSEASDPGLPAYPYGFQESWSEMDVWRRLAMKVK